MYHAHFPKILKKLFFGISGQAILFMFELLKIACPLIPEIIFTLPTPSLPSCEVHHRACEAGASVILRSSAMPH
jgi:hypothetical protein